MTLSDSLHDAVADDVTPLDLDAVHGRASARRLRRGRATVAAGVLTLAALAGVVGVAATGNDREQAYGTVVSGGGSGQGQASSDEQDGQASSDPSTTAPPASTEPPTTVAPETTAPEVTTPPPSTTAPAPEVVELHGTWEGTGRTGFGDQGCPDMSGTMRRDVTMDDGSVWTSGEDVCASVVDDMWVAEGSFFLTAPDGSTLTGPYVISTPMATPGVPYTITFTEGTGAFARATGSCHVTIEITPPGGLAQDQTGEMTCTITLDGTMTASSPTPTGTVPEAA